MGGQQFLKQTPLYEESSAAPSACFCRAQFRAEETVEHGVMTAECLSPPSLLLKRDAVGSVPVLLVMGQERGQDTHSSQ